MSLWKRVALSTLLVLCAAIALAPSAGPSKRIPNGVRIAGVNVSGLDAGQAKQQIGARFATPVRFKFAREHWAVSPETLGMNAEIGDAVSRAQDARSGDDIGVSVDVNRDAVKGYVSSLDERFGIPAENAVVVGLVDGHPKIADSQWGRTVRRQTMVRGIVRMLRTRIRPELPVVMETLKPSVEKSGFGPVVVINRGANSLQLFSGEQLGAELPRGDRPLAVPDSDGHVPDRRHADEPVVAPTRLGLGEGAEADSAGPREPARHALDGALGAGRRHPRDA